MRDVVVIGAGAAGLVCAADLNRAGIDTLLLEAGDGIGGRVRTDQVDGFRLDRGFQILLTAYPQVKQRLDVGRLDISRFAPGALVNTPDGLSTLADPLRRPGDLLATLRSPAAGAADELRTIRLVAEVCLRSPRHLLRRRDLSTAQRLANAGFSPEYIDRFWRPFFAGIQLDPDLEVSSRRFDIVLRMLALGSTGLPREGIGAITAQLGESLDADQLRLNAAVRAVEPGRVTLSDGEVIPARAVVVATDGPGAHQLLGASVPDPGSRPVAACWFEVPSGVISRPFLILDGSGAGPATNVVVMSAVQPSYAPAGRHLAVAAIPGSAALAEDLSAAVTRQVAGLLEVSERELSLLRTDRIPHGQPLQRPPLPIRRRVDLGQGIFVCGDHRDTASLQGAMFSGQRTAQSVQAHLGRALTTARPGG